MNRFYEPDLTVDVDSPFVRDAANKLVRRTCWLDMNDRPLVMVMVNGIGAHLSNDQKRAHLTDLRPKWSSRSSKCQPRTIKRVRFTPQKRTLVERVEMSAMCQKRTSCAAVKNVVVPSRGRRPQAAPAAQSARDARL